MRTTGKSAGRKAQHRRVLTVLLACSTLASPVQAVAQTLYPSSVEPRPSSTFSATTNTTGTARGDADEGSTGTSSVEAPAATSRSGSAPADTVAGNASATTSLSDPAVLTTGAIPSGNSTPANDPPYVDDLNQSYTDLVDPPLDDPTDEEAVPVPGDPTGIRLGTLLLRPSISQSINRETIRDGSTETRRSYLGTTFRGTLTSDWARHELSINGEATNERNFGGGDQPKPEGRIDGNLRLDLADDTIANISAGYEFEREDNSDPNAIGGASTQSGVHQFNGGVTLERDAGILRGLAGLGISREIYGDARLGNGSSLDLSDRDHTLVDGRLRLGYEISPALIPFVEVRGGRNFYDNTRDAAGYERSSWTYGGRSGVQLDLGEKLRGELGAGYERVEYDDARLTALDGFTIDGRTVWSPQRGTDLELALRTTLQDSATPGESGWVEYTATATLTHQLRHSLVGRLTGGATERVFPQGPDETTWLTGAGLTWSLSRYLDLTGGLEYEYTDRSSSDTETLRAGLGLTLRR